MNKIKTYICLFVWVIAILGHSYAHMHVIKTRQWKSRFDVPEGIFYSRFVDNRPGSKLLSTF